MSDIGNQQIFQLLTEIRDDVKATAATVNKLQVHVEGNGGKGLLKRQNETDARLDEVKEWQDKRPKVCPATAKEITKSLGRIVAIASGVLALVIGLSIFGNRFLGNTKTEALQEQMKSLQEALEKLSN